MKKKLAVLLTAALAAASLTACGGPAQLIQTLPSLHSQMAAAVIPPAWLWHGGEIRPEMNVPRRSWTCTAKKILVLPLTDSSPNSTTTGTNWQPQQQDIP